MVGAGYDEGPIVFEHDVDVLSHDTAESLFARVQTTEKSHIASDVATFIAHQAQYNETKEENT
jgi:folate-dependent phosphoribosylglycinamide formyltransferase PurN